MLKYYEKNISADGLVFCYFKLAYYLNVASFFILFIALTIFTLCLLSKTFILYGFLFLGLSLVYSILMFFVLRSKAKNVLKNQYNIDSSGLYWHNEKFRELQVELLRKYLEDNQLITVSKVKLLIELLAKESERIKVPPLVAPGVIIAIFIPLWVQVIGIIFKGISDAELAIFVMISLLVLCSVAVFFISLIKTMFTDILEFTIAGENSKITYLVRLLEELLLRITDQVT